MPLTYDRAELMPLHNIDPVVLRDACRRRLDSLELWLKRVVHEELSDSFGDYMKAQSLSGKIMRDCIVFAA